MKKQFILNNSTSKTESLRTLINTFYGCWLVSVFYLSERSSTMNKEKPQKNKQKLTDRDLRELMGQNMQRLKRAKGGAMRRK